MGDIRFWCARCGQPIVADGNTVGLRADCPNCRLPLIIPPPAHREESENFEFRAPEGLSEGAEGRAFIQAEIQLAYVREQLEATAETCSRLGVHLARKQRESRFFLLERLALARELGVVRRLLEEARRELVSQGNNNANGRECAAADSGRLGSMTRGEAGVGDAFGAASLGSQSARCSGAVLGCEGGLAGSTALIPARGNGPDGPREEVRRGDIVHRWAADSEDQTRLEKPSGGNAGIDAFGDDHATLRGLIERQNCALRECYKQLRRYRTAQLGLRILYGLVVLLGFLLCWESFQYLVDL
jgi:hypothetical protein